MTNKYNYLFIVPRYSEQQLGQYAFPLGICYVAAKLKDVKGAQKVYTINLNHIEGNTSDIIEKILDKYAINVVLTAGLCLDFAIVNDITMIIKNYDKNIITIVGGGIITGDPETAMEALSFVDYGIIGEGEESVVELCDCLENNDDCSKVQGIIFKRADSMIISDSRQDIRELSTVPWPDYEGFSFMEYINSNNLANIMATKKNTLFMITSRSCPFNCTFCFHASGKTYRQRKIEDIFDELDFLISKYKIEYIFFVDELFGTSYDRLKEFCHKIKPYKLKGWYSYFRVDQITLEKVELLKDAGCISMCFGLESADNKVLKSMNKKITIEQIDEALNLVHNAGINFLGTFIFGDVAETYESSMNTLHWWYSHPQYQNLINLVPIACYPGTKIYWQAVASGKIKDRVQFLKDGCPIINISSMSDEDYNKMMLEVQKARLSIINDMEFVQLEQIDYLKHQYTFSGNCNSCGSKNVWSNKPMFMDAYLICDKCGQKHNIPTIKDMLACARTNLDKILSKYNKIGIWGIGLSVEKFLLNIGVDEKSNIYLFDRSLTSLGQKTVEKPEKISKYNIDLMIIPTVRFFDSISSEVQQEYGLKNIIGIYDLIDNNYL